MSSDVTAVKPPPPPGLYNLELSFTVPRDREHWGQRRLPAWRCFLGGAERLGPTLPPAFGGWLCGSWKRPLLFPFTPSSPPACPWSGLRTTISFYLVLFYTTLVMLSRQVRRGRASASPAPGRACSLPLGLGARLEQRSRQQSGGRALVLPPGIACPPVRTRAPPELTGALRAAGRG